MTHALALALSALAAVDPQSLRWGADAQGGAPYVFQDPNNPGQLIGFEVELAAALAARLGLKPQPVQGPWDKLLALLERGDFDLALNGIEVNEAAGASALLSRPYFRAAEKLTIRRGDLAAPKSLNEVKGRRVGTLPGTAAERLLRQAGAHVSTYDGGQNDLYDDLRLGRLEAVLLDAPAAKFYADIHPDLETLSGDLGHVDYAVAVKRSDRALLARVDAALLALEADGTLRQIYQRWGLLEPGDRADAFERWRAAVGAPLSFWQRLTQRYPRFLPLFFKGAGLTLLTSVCAMGLAMLWGIALAFLRRSTTKVVRLSAIGYIELFRGTPLLVQLTLLYFGLPELGVNLPPFAAGVLALGLNYAAAEAENYRAGLESVQRGQLEAASVLGLSRWQALTRVVGPQAVRIAIPPMTNDFIALLKDSSLVSAVTLTELTKTYANLASSTGDHLGLGAVVAAFYLLLGLPFALLARRAERHFGRHLERRAR